VDLIGRKLVAVVAHPDDETVGCGGILSRAAREGAICRVVLPLRRADPRGLSNWPALLEQFKSACITLGAVPIVTTEPIPDLTAESEIAAIHESILPSVDWADIVLTHWPGDVHQAHRAVSRAVEIATRPFRCRRNVAFFEVATSSDQTFENSFSPNLFVTLAEEDIQRKRRAMGHYLTEQAAGRNADDLELRARFRGAQVGLQYAEALVFARAFI
jgi:LmbE family N-acetylglucosaminyl deacetylase